jgi:hypothetical protein
MAKAMVEGTAMMAAVATAAGPAELAAGAWDSTR